MRWRSGDSSVASGDYATAIGQGSRATGTGAVATGQNAQATGDYSIAMGQGSSASGAYATAIGAGAVATGANSVAIGAGSTDGGQSNVVSVGAPGAERRIVNLAPGVNGTDAVNVDQLTSGLGNLQNQFNTQIGGLQSQITNNLAAAYAGTAVSLAAAGLRYDDRPGKMSMSTAIAYYHDQMGLALGLGGTSESGRWRYDVGASISPTLAKPDVGVFAGVSYTFN